MLTGWRGTSVRGFSVVMMRCCDDVMGHKAIEGRITNFYRNVKLDIPHGVDAEGNLILRRRQVAPEADNNEV